MTGGMPFSHGISKNIEPPLQAQHLSAQEIPTIPIRASAKLQTRVNATLTPTLGRESGTSLPEIGLSRKFWALTDN